MTLVLVIPWPSQEHSFWKFRDHHKSIKGEWMHRSKERRGRRRRARGLGSPVQRSIFPDALSGHRAPCGCEGGRVDDASDSRLHASILNRRAPRIRISFMNAF